MTIRGLYTISQQILQIRSWSNAGRELRAKSKNCGRFCGASYRLHLLKRLKVLYCQLVLVLRLWQFLLEPFSLAHAPLTLHRLLTQDSNLETSFP